MHLDHKRRGFITGLASLSVITTVPAAGAQATEAPIAPPLRPGRSAFLARAFALRDAAVRAGDQAYGAVVVKDGKIVGQGPSRVVTNTDATAHAEMEAIRDASRRLGTRDLSGCILYSSSAPCAMCETAAYWAGIAKKVHGAEGTDSGAPRYGGCR
ncbi:MAG TPA: nucleoside deaminase [Alphaproteobacteria bacterium]|nr:nucleoside deaminase [Alphaproteobacteria bacterium]